MAIEIIKRGKMHDKFTVSCKEPICGARFSYERSDIKSAGWDEQQVDKFVKCPECGSRITHKECSNEYD
ncbi:MAG: hypothetical protein LBO09_08800 [Candidatus Peribacteria bacterium]|jgi:DNA-directed RNA polymerase subunit RPC12/RpoP|nr:hypothetical protein [Candidatus Peribacteria bacterium]